MLPVQGQVLPVQMSPLSPGLSPMGFYEDLGALGQELGIRMFVYIGRHQGEKQGSIVRSLYICYSTWASVNMEKTVLEPSQCIEFLGFTLDTTRMELSLPVQKTKKIWAESQQLLEVEQGTASTLPD